MWLLHVIGYVNFTSIAIYALDVIHTRLSKLILVECQIINTMKGDKEGIRLNEEIA